METDISNKKTELSIEGMNCTNCALGIKKQLEKDGFKNVDVNFASAEVSFSQLDKENITKAKSRIRSMGYTVIEDTNKTKKGLSFIEIKFIISLIFTLPLLIAMFLPYHIFHNPFFQLALCIPVFAIGVWHFGRSAFQSIKAGVPNMDVLIILGSSAAFFYSLYGTLNNLGHNFQYYETSASIITLVLFGNLLEYRSVKRTTSAIDDLVKLQKSKAKRIIINTDESESVEEVDSSNIKKNDLILINTGDKIPVDGKIYWGTGSVDESMISGESLPIDKIINDVVIGGTILVAGSIKFKATAIGKETMLSQIIDMVKDAQQDKPKMQNLADKISAVFVPLVVGIAILTFLIWYYAIGVIFQIALMNSIAVLVISCPCALGLAIPTAVVVGIGRMAKNGILVKGGSTLETIANIKRIVFDKTGTLTTGNFKIKKLKTFDITEKSAKSIIYSLEKHSSHPIAKSIVKEYTASELKNFQKINELKGIGIEAIDECGIVYKIGSYDIALHSTEETNHTAYLIIDEKLVAWLDIEDEIKPEAKRVISFLKDNNITPVILSGDSKAKCEYIAGELGINKFYYKKLPNEKLCIIKKLAKKELTAMVGDGINDAPALAQASLSISLSNATQIAIKSAQVIILKGDLELITKAWKISKITLSTIKQNLFWAFFYNIIAIPIAAAGLLNPMVAAASMAFSDIIVVANSLRLKNKKTK
ncbi:MAG: cadmium-translocating P-type ATPase [Bacteroidetes bacterium]|nr:cadmium-translocating P-type ATPase [Bacteroidota bacterium]